MVGWLAGRYDQLKMLSKCILILNTKCRNKLLDLAANGHCVPCTPISPRYEGIYNFTMYLHKENNL